MSQRGCRSRTGVDLVVPVEVWREHDEQHDDHDVPDRRRDRGDREVIVGLQDADEQAVESEQQHDREQHLGEPYGQSVELRAELRPDEQRHDDPGGEDEEGSDRAEADQHDPEERRGQPQRFAALALLQQVREDRHERGRQRRLGEQVGHEVRHPSEAIV